MISGKFLQNELRITVLLRRKFYQGHACLSLEIGLQPFHYLKKTRYILYHIHVSFCIFHRYQRFPNSGMPNRFSYPMREPENQMRPFNNIASVYEEVAAKVGVG